MDLFKLVAIKELTLLVLKNIEKNMYKELGGSSLNYLVPHFNAKKKIDYSNMINLSVKDVVKNHSHYKISFINITSKSEFVYIIHLIVDSYHLKMTYDCKIKKLTSKRVHK